MNGLDVFRYMDNLGPSIEKCPYAKMNMLQKSPNGKCPNGKYPSAGMFAMPKYYHTETSQSHNIPVPEYLHDDTFMKPKCLCSRISRYRAER